MKETEFRDWLAKSGQGEATVDTRVKRLSRIEGVLGDIDACFDREGYVSILEQFRYSSKDQRAGRENPSPLVIDGELRTNLASYSQVLRNYRDFRENKGTRVSHGELLKQLTREHILAAMRECDTLGLEAFLSTYQYSKPKKYWVLSEDAQVQYPVKGIVGAALQYLTDGQAVTASEFFNGYGEVQSVTCLRDLGFEILDGRQDTFSRHKIEAAMDAYAAYLSDGAHADVFAVFGEAKDYWVRSSRARNKRVFPSKPIVGYLIGKAPSNFNGGWSQSSDAAARLHQAGYVIVDADDVPLPLPEQYIHLERGADRMRKCALNYYVESAREQGAVEVSIAARDLHNALGLKNDFPNMCQTLGGEKFLKLAKLDTPTITGPNPSSTTIFTYPLNANAKGATMPDCAQDPLTPTTNLILYGPPGTGKTYRTAFEAVRLCDGEAKATQLEAQGRGALMEAYSALCKAGRIEFTTFHQSMSYEEFVEGLRPTQADGDVGFQLAPEDGIFKRIAKRAEKSRAKGTQKSGFFDGRKIFQMSLGVYEPRGENEVFEHCMRDGIALLGFEDIDYTDNKYNSRDEILKVCEERGTKSERYSMQAGAVQMLDVFRNEVSVGDILVVSMGNSKYRAIGEVAGAYEYVPRDRNSYCQRRAVNWLWVDRGGRPVSEIHDTNFMQKSLYSLQANRLNLPLLEKLINAEDVDTTTGLQALQDHVLIIDEINRANISKVFGELITLLEADKRVGAENEICLTLPYSKALFGVPRNLHIIGTMNTADRSIALLDTALRRRFEFKEVMPNPDVLRGKVPQFDLAKLLTDLNGRIEYLFDREHQIGHAYFTSCQSVADVAAVIRDKIIPLLAEYFYEDWAKIAQVLGDGDLVQGARKTGKFLRVETIQPPTGLELDGAEERLRWLVQSEFDLSDYKLS
ncbi:MULTISPECIES: AAA family ATPase [Pacificibacter]|uniref:AAA family ATPase n=1 Tax=Pacificibacter TaxID=1042323 RepID=UPI001C0975DD|nr:MULTISPECIES: AAA family ATPase [Pacificibacter]MBU2934892.1 AAA family ATPase [Pacificibacter marinus]MDO6617347.1 AAA family ATPase [Pacificibacter sp. 1_MG-2023]